MEGNNRSAIIHTWIQTIVTVGTIVISGLIVLNRFENQMIVQQHQIGELQRWRDVFERHYDKDHPRIERAGRRG